MEMLLVQAVRICLFAAVFSTDLRIFTEASNTTQEENYANVTTTCGREAMTVSVEVESDFSGEIYPDGFLGGDGCFFFSTNASDGYTVYKHDYDYAPSCGSIWTQQENDTQEFSAVTFIQFDPRIIQTTDIRHRSSCTFTSDQRVNGQLGMVNGSRFRETNETVAGVLPTLTIVDINGSSLGQNDVVVVGDLLEVRIQLKTTPAFESMVVTECLASSKSIEKFPLTETLKLTDSDGCPTTTAVLAGAAKYDSKSSGLEVVYTLPVFAFLFVDGLDENNRNQLHFSCNVFLCSADNSSLCAQPSCDSRRRRSAGDEADWESDHSALRRRREAGEEGTMVEGSVQVRMDAESDVPGTVDKAIQGSEKVDFTQCVNNPKTQSLLAVIVIVIIGLITTVVALTCLNHRLRRRLRKLAKKEKEATGGGFR